MVLQLVAAAARGSLLDLHESLLELRPAEELLPATVASCFRAAVSHGHLAVAEYLLRRGHQPSEQQLSELCFSVLSAAVDLQEELEEKKRNDAMLKVRHGRLTRMDSDGLGLTRMDSD